MWPVAAAVPLSHVRQLTVVSGASIRRTRVTGCIGVRPDPHKTTAAYEAAVSTNREEASNASVPPFMTVHAGG
jgi:hypothetical protein